VNDQPRMLPACIHVGVPKSGTTTLQFNLFARHSQIVYIGKPYDDPSVSEEASQAVADLADSLWQVDELEFDLARAKALFELGVRGRGQRPGRCLVFSEEGLTGASGADRVCTAGRLHRIFGSCRILITVRNPLDALLAGHRWCLARGLIHVGFDAWIRQCRTFSLYNQCRNDFPLRQYLYGRLVRAYQNEFGADRVLVLPLEMLSKDPAGYIHRLSGFLGVDEGEASRLLDQGPIQNRSLSAWATRYQNVQRNIRRLTRRVCRAGEETEHLGLYEGGIHGRVTRWLDRWGPPHRGMSASTRAFLEAFYAQDNRLLEEVTGEPLSGYGYVVASS